jgi:hypothetical protein
MERRVSEKTLELNIAAELLGIIRTFPGCQNAIWIGMKQNQEARNGIDELINNVPSGFHLALQFKSPRPIPQDQLPYLFSINDRQNNNLLRLAQIRPNAVYYVLPHYNSLTRMRNMAPNLKNDTWVLRVLDLVGLPASTNQQGTHRVESFGGYALIYSDSFRAKTFKGTGLLEDIFKSPGALEQNLIDHKTLKWWLGEFYFNEKQNPYRVGHLLRGFSTIYLG